MQDAWLPTLAAVGIVSLVSLVGAIAGMRLFRRHLVILTLVAVAAGSLLGDALLHLLPEASVLWGGFTPELAGYVLLGFGVFFLLESTLRFGHAHGEVVQSDHAHGHADGHHPHQHAHGADHTHGHDHGHHGGHDDEHRGIHDHGHQPSALHPAPTGGSPSRVAHGHPGSKPVAPFAWMNLLGDALHNFLDGIVIAAAFVIDPLAGIATTVAVVLHEIPQELGDFAVLLRAGVTPRKAVMFNLLSALTAFVGAALYLLLPFDTDTLEKFALPIAAGGFLYIAAADLIPELHHHTGDRHVVNILGGFAVGLAAMAGLLLLD